MEVKEKLIKQITETKYLNVENTERYRPIIRLFFEKYEKMEYWLFKEDVFNALKESPYFKDYTLELCEQDLLKLVEWQSLTNIQDTSNVNSLQEFKNRRYRYSLTEYGVEIERLVLRLESLKVKTSSLEPKLFEKIKLHLEKILALEDPSEMNETFEELNHYFTTLNESYKDFLKIFHEAKTEELMKSESFIAYKDQVVKYLKDFIGGFQINTIKILEIIKTIPEDFEEKLMNQLIEYRKSIPNMEPDFDYDYLKEINLGKWRSIIKWFQGEVGSPSESVRLKQAINDIIHKIMKNVSAILEMQMTSLHRKEDYKHIITLFSNVSSMEEAHALGNVVFGISKVKHYTTIERKTENPDYSVLDLENVKIELASHSRKMKEKVEKQPIKDKRLEKERQLNEILSIRNHEREILEKYIQDGVIEMKKLKGISRFERRFILSLLTQGMKKKGEYVYNGEHGISYKVIKQSEDSIELLSEDGCFTMPDLEIVFGGQNE